jgi:hypothetical protein
MKVIVTGKRRSGKSRLIAALTAVEPKLTLCRLHPNVVEDLGLQKMCIRYRGYDRRELLEASKDTENWIIEADFTEDGSKPDFSSFEEKGILVICTVSQAQEDEMKGHPHYTRDDDFPAVVVAPESEAKLEVVAHHIIAWLKKGNERFLEFFKAELKDFQIRQPDALITEAAWTEEDNEQLKIMIRPQDGTYEYSVFNLARRPKHFYSMRV